MITTIANLRAEIHARAGQRYILGSEDLIDFLLISWLARGHVLIEGPLTAYMDKVLGEPPLYTPAA